jgi:hypothetical protein
MIMRLTESPRKLAEMRPEVAWSGEVQASLDKALQRDVNARYATATEFGRSLSRALEKMATTPSGTQIRASGTPGVVEPLTSLPPTRVGAERAGAAPANAAKIAVGEGTTVGVPARGRRRALGMYGGGVILVAALLTAAMVYRRDANKAPARDGVTLAANATSEKGSGAANRFAAPIDTTKLPDTTGSATTPAGNAPTRATHVVATLDSLEKVAFGQDLTPNEAAKVVRTLTAMKPRVTGDEQVVQAAIIEAMAESSRKNQTAACAALHRVEKIAPGTSRARMFATTLSVAAC